MKMELHLGRPEDETRVSVSALRRIFYGEPWEAIEPHARRAWTAGQFAEGTPWEYVRDQSRAGMLD